MNIFNTLKNHNETNLGDRRADCIVNGIVCQLKLPKVLGAFTIA